MPDAVQWSSVTFRGGSLFDAAWHLMTTSELICGNSRDEVRVMEMAGRKTCVDCARYALTLDREEDKA